jgi:hypothetical protein
MANSLQTMITRIGIEIRRPSLGTDGDSNAGGGDPALNSTIALAIFDAIQIYRKDRFRISDINPSAPPSFNTVVSRSVYTGSDNSNISTAYRFEYLNVFVGSTVEKMTQRTAEELLLLLQQNQQSGQPTDWCYQGNSINIYPIPNAIWQIFIGGHIDIAPPATLIDTTNVWMNWAEMLIRSRAKYELSVHKTRNPTMASEMSPDPDGGPNGKPGQTWRAWRMLKNETNKVVGRGVIRPMQW